jgi:hypothetical protein
MEAKTQHIEAKMVALRRKSVIVNTSILKSRWISINHLIPYLKEINIIKIPMFTLLRYISPILIIALFTIGKKWNQPMCPSTDEQKMW